jgi:hypothetical protein
VLWADGTVLTPPAGAGFSDDLTFAVFVDADGTVKTWETATQAAAPGEPGPHDLPAPRPRPPRGSPTTGGPSSTPWRAPRRSNASSIWTRARRSTGQTRRISTSPSTPTTGSCWPPTATPSSMSTRSASSSTRARFLRSLGPSWWRCRVANRGDGSTTSPPLGSRSPVTRSSPRTSHTTGLRQRVVGRGHPRRRLPDLCHRSQ